MKFNFNFGTQKTTIFQYAITGVILTSIVGTLTQCTKIPEDTWYKDLIKAEQLFPNWFPKQRRVLDDYINHDDHLSGLKAEIAVDRAIADYERLTGDDGKVRIPKPRYSEKPPDSSVCYTKECQSLGGEMRLCAPWVLDCPKENKGS